MIKGFSILIVIILLFSGTTAVAAEKDEETVTGKIIDITEKPTDTFPEYHMSVRLLDGSYKDELIQVTFTQVKYSQWDFIPNVGQTLVLRVFTTSEGVGANVVSVSRQDNLTLLFLIFFILLIIFGRKKGLLSLIALVVSGIIIYLFFIPLVLKGYNIILLTIMTAIAVIVISFIIISGFTKKSLASILGTVCGIISAVVLSEIFSRVCVISGAVSEEAFLLASESGVDIDFSGLFISGIIIGTIGVVMDVSMSITSLVFELKENSPEMSFPKLVSSGLKVGKDMMATMINTLVLAYVGTSLPLLFVFITNASSVTYAINTETVAGEIIRSLCGSIGLILTVPLTSVIASYIILKKRGKLMAPYKKQSGYKSRIR